MIAAIGSGWQIEIQGFRNMFNRSCLNALCASNMY